MTEIEVAKAIQHKVRGLGIDAFIHYFGDGGNHYAICLGNDVEWKFVPSKKIWKNIKKWEKELDCKIDVSGTAHSPTRNKKTSFTIDHNSKTCRKNQDAYPNFGTLQLNFIKKIQPKLK